MKKGKNRKRGGKVFFVFLKYYELIPELSSAYKRGKLKQKKKEVSVEVSGDTYALKDILKKIGLRWTGSGWMKIYTESKGYITGAPPWMRAKSVREVEKIYKDLLKLAKELKKTGEYGYIVVQRLYYDEKGRIARKIDDFRYEE